MLQRWILVLVMVSGLLAVACGPKARATPTRVATGTPALTPTPASALTPTPTPTAEYEEVRIDMDKIFPPGPGRILVLLDCVQCHNLAPLVIAGSAMDGGAWDRNRRDHEVGRVLALTTE